MENVLSEVEAGVAGIIKTIKNMTALLKIKRDSCKVHKRNEFTVL